MHILINIVRPGTDLRGHDLLNHMKRIPGKYDPYILDFLLGRNLQLDYVTEDLYVRVDSLKTGMIVIADIRSISGHLLLKSNTILNETFINVIKQWHARDPISEPLKMQKIKR
jgi:hypothetical protein